MSRPTRPFPTLPPGPADIGRWRAARHAAGRMLLALDFDGTLAPIVQRPEDARLADDTRRVLEGLAERGDTTVALVSGRALADVRERADVGGAYFAGNHGLEIAGPGISRVHEDAREARGQLEEALRELDASIGDIAGVQIEDKGLTLSIHYRRAAEQDHAQIRERVARARTAGLRITEGKRVIELRPDVSWHKGKAVLWLIEELAIPDAAPILYIGDDVTDEDAFVALGARGEGILVSDHDRRTAARFRIRSTEEVTHLLGSLAEQGGAGAA
jgi:trehalose 6-phosphate phosphatase